MIITENELHLFKNEKHCLILRHYNTTVKIQFFNFKIDFVNASQDFEQSSKINNINDKKKQK